MSVRRAQFQRRVALHAALLLVTLAALVDAPVVSGQTEYSPEAIKAAFLYRFAAYVEWPPVASERRSFVIATLCDDGVAEQLRRILGSRPINGLPAEVRQVRRLGEVDGAQILYVGPSCSQELSVSLSALSGQPTLIVTDDDDGLHGNAVINFVMVNQHIRFEVSLLSAQRSGLRISSELLSVAARVLGSRMRSNVHCAVPLIVGPKWDSCWQRVVVR